MTARGPRNSGDLGDVAAPTKTVEPAATAGTPEVKPDPTAGPAPDTKVGDTAGATAGTVTPPDPTAGATAGTVTPPDPTAGATAGSTPPPQDTTATTHDANDDDGDDKPGTKLPPPKPDLSLVAQEGSLFAPKAAAPIVASVEEAKAHCAGLKKSKFAKLGQWKLGTSGEVLKFKDNKDVQKLAYWVSDAGSAGRAKRVALINGSINEADPKTFTRTRPLCVAKR